MEAWQAIAISVTSTLAALAIWRAASVGMKLNTTVQLMLQRLVTTEKKIEDHDDDLKELFRLHRTPKANKDTLKVKSPEGNQA